MPQKHCRVCHSKPSPAYLQAISSLSPGHLQLISRPSSGHHTRLRQASLPPSPLASPACLAILPVLQFSLSHFYRVISCLIEEEGGGRRRKDKMRDYFECCLIALLWRCHRQHLSRALKFGSNLKAKQNCCDSILIVTTDECEPHPSNRPPGEQSGQSKGH